MNRSNRRRRLALAALLATAAISSAAPAQATTTTSADCQARLEQLEAQFREVEERRGWDAATEWWQKRWHAYYQSCGG